MPVLLEGTAVVMRNDALERCIDGGAANFCAVAPNAMSYGDEGISQASFMSPRDAEMFRDKMVMMGLNGSIDAPEVVVVDAHRRKVMPQCDWLVLMEYKGSLIASLSGDESEVVIAPETWNPESGPSLQHMSAEDVANRLEFVRRDVRVDVYRDKETGQLLYSARLHETPDELFRQAAEVVLKHMRHPGQPPPEESVQDEVREAIGSLQQLASTYQDGWRIWFLLGKAWHTVDRPKRAIAALERAAELGEDDESDSNDGPAHKEVVHKELAGILLETGQTDRACRVGEKAVALRPDDPELLGNLAVAYLLDGRTESAEKSLDHALRINKDDATNRYLKAKLRQIAAGQIPIPRSLAELEGRPPQSPSESHRIDVGNSRGANRPHWFKRMLRRFAKS